MDPHTHQLSTMDPKLKEAYEKVMKTPVAETKADTPTPEVATSKTTIEIKQAVTEQKGDTEEKTTVENPKYPQIAATFTPPSTKHAAGETVHIGYAKKPAQKFILEKKKLGIPPALYVIGCIVFFIIYTLFWMKIFGIPIPLLP